MTPLRVLIVEDDPTQREQLGGMVARMGHEPVLAVDGASALRVFDLERPDAVLLDLMLPGADGLTVAAALRARVPNRWLPILVISAAIDDAMLAEGLRAGASWCVPKPVSYQLLEAKLQGFSMVIEAERELSESRAELSRYRDTAEQERAFAKRILSERTRIDASLAGAARKWIGAAERFSGDVIVAERAPSGAICALLVDGIGHGLSAAFVAMPIARTFQAMTSKGFALAKIAAELNASVHSLLQNDQFAATTLLSFDPHDMRLEVWNGGNPPALLVDDAGAVRARFESRHLPLGILKEDQFDPATEVTVLAEPMQVVLFSDGLMEYRGAGGQPFGVRGIENVLAAAAPRARLAAITGQMAGDQKLEDDCSLLLLDCRPGAATTPPPAPAAHASQEPADARRVEWEFTLRLQAAALRNADPVPLLGHAIEHLAATGCDRQRVHLVITELFNNAVDHGLLGLDSGLKEGPEGFERWAQERARRFAALQSGWVEFTIAGRRDEAGALWLEIRVGDSGAGFDTERLRMTSADTAAPHGRGIPLVRALSESLSYADGGREAHAVCAA